MWMLLHGFTGSPRSWDRVVESRAWPEPPLRPILAGHGPHWRAAGTVSFEAELSRLASMASSAAAPRLIAGYSLGARLALGLVATRPALFDAAVLVGVHPGLTEETARAERRALDQERAGLLRTAGLESFVAWWEQQPLFVTQRLLSPEIAERQREIRRGHDAEGLARALEGLGLAHMPDYGSRLGEIRIPITVMAGAQDPKFSDIARSLGKQHPHVCSSIVQGAGHNLLIEAPEAVAAELCAAEERVGR
jgi:2-succinyl-6-hydroxy-2,4-cyclohexadiene-1-carboxylate synthase